MTLETCGFLSSFKHWIVRLIVKSAFYTSLWRGCLSNLLSCCEIKVGPGFAGTHCISKLGRGNGKLPLVRMGAGVLLCLLGSFIDGMPLYRQFHSNSCIATWGSTLVSYWKQKCSIGQMFSTKYQSELKATSSATWSCFGHAGLLTLVCPLAFRCHFWTDVIRETVAAGIET